MVMGFLGICAMTYLHEPMFAAGAAQVHQVISKIADPDTQKQMEIPIAVIYLLPIGLKGALCAAMLLGIFGGDSNHLHSWSSVFVQDVILPLRKKPLSPKQHIFFLRLAIAAVALFAFIFGVFLNPHQYIYMWWAVTSIVYTGGAGVAIIGGLYWKKGTAAGAWAGMIVGSTLGLGGIFANQIYYQIYQRDLPLNGTEISFIAMLVASTVYVVVSLLTCEKDFNMDRMLHRGAYANITAEVGEEAQPIPKKKKLSWASVIGYDENFTLSDKWIAISLFCWSMLFSLIAIFGTLWNLFIWRWPVWVWSEYWHFTAVVIPAILAAIVIVWFTWCGILDVIDLFRRLESAKNNPLDNGQVLDHQNLEESILPDAISPLDSSPKESGSAKK